jgi:hypothetical protein
LQKFFLPYCEYFGFSISLYREDCRAIEKDIEIAYKESFVEISLNDNFLVVQCDINFSFYDEKDLLEILSFANHNLLWIIFSWYQIESHLDVEIEIRIFQSPIKKKWFELNEENILKKSMYKLSFKIIGHQLEVPVVYIDSS